MMVQKNSKIGMDIKKRDVIEVVIPNKPEYVSVIRLTASSIANRMGFDIDKIEDIKVAISEACSNAILHGVCENESNFKISFIIEMNRLEIIVCDRGAGCIAENIIKPDLKQPKEGGLGIFVIKSLMDNVDIKSDIGKGTIIKMTKYVGDDIQ